MTWLDKHERIFELIETRYELHPPKAAGMVVVVRCRDCKHFTYADSEHDNNDWCAKHEHIAWSVNGFCAWASRKEGAE